MRSARPKLRCPAHGRGGSTGELGPAYKGLARHCALFCAILKNIRPISADIWGTDLWRRHRRKPRAPDIRGWPLTYERETESAGQLMSVATFAASRSYGGAKRADWSDVQRKGHFTWPNPPADCVTLATIRWTVAAVQSALVRSREELTFAMKGAPRIGRPPS
jgi:hypothetical protein